MELKEQTIESNEVFTGRLVKLRVDTVRLPDGRETTREVVVHRGAVAVVPMTDDGKVVMVRQFRQAAGEVLMEIPAGTLEPGEDAAECAHREIQEEVGYRIRRSDPDVPVLPRARLLDRDAAHVSRAQTHQGDRGTATPTSSSRSSRRQSTRHCTSSRRARSRTPRQSAGF